MMSFQPLRIGLTAALLALGATSAHADATPCCAVATSGDNVGKACVKELPTNAQAIPDREAVAGCVDGADGVCIGGAISPNRLNGCIGLGVLFYAGGEPLADDADCTTAAVDACCAHDACYTP